MPHSPHSKLVSIDNDDPTYSVREYIASMSHQLAQLARQDGDEALAAVLASAADLAQRSR